MRPKTPRIKPIRSRLCDKIPNIEKEVTLLEVAEKLEKIVFNMHNESDIDLISKKLKFSLWIRWGSSRSGSPSCPRLRYQQQGTRSRRFQCAGHPRHP